MLCTECRKLIRRRLKDGKDVVLKKEKKINLAGAAAYALILTGALYLVFVKLLSIVLPRGLFF